MKQKYSKGERDGKEPHILVPEQKAAVFEVKHCLHKFPYSSVIKKTHPWIAFLSLFTKKRKEKKIRVKNQRQINASLKRTKRKSRSEGCAVWLEHQSTDNWDKGCWNLFSPDDDGNYHIDDDCCIHSQQILFQLSFGGCGGVVADDRTSK